MSSSLRPIGAAGLPFVVGRLKKNHSITPGTSDPAEALGLIYTDTIVHDAAGASICR